MQLDDFVLKYRPIDRTPFSQRAWLTDVGEIENGGRCYGFALAYLMVVSKGAPGKELIRALNIAANKDNPDRKLINEIVAKSSKMVGTKEWVGTDLYGLQHARIRRNEAMLAFGLNLVGEADFQHRSRKFDDLATYVATDSQSLSMLCTPNHALAIASRPAGESVWGFFDPNFGEATFRSKADLHNCVSNFFANRKVKGVYRRKKVSENATGETRERQQLEVRKMTVSVLKWVPI